MDRRPSAIDVATLPYPGFPTDLQPFVITLNAIAEGDALVTENVFEGRFMFVNELLRLGQGSELMVIMQQSLGSNSFLPRRLWLQIFEPEQVWSWRVWFLMELPL